MSMNSSWVPQEDSLTLLSERTWLDGAILTGVGYGVVITLYFMCLRQLIRSTNNDNRINRLSYIVYTTLITLFGTLFMAACARMTELSFIDFRLYPTGPAGFENDMFSIPVDELGNVMFVPTNWFADGLVVWRCMIIYRSCRYPTYIVMAIPFLAYLGSLAMGIMWLIQVSASQSSPWLTSSINFTPPYFWLSLALNLSMTLAIVSRLVLLRWRISSALGPSYGGQYTSFAAMLVESSVLYSAFSLLFLVPFALNHPLANMFLQILSQVEIIAPLLIIYRVALGEAWSTNTTTEIFSQVESRNPNRPVQVNRHKTIGTEDLGSMGTNTVAGRSGTNIEKSQGDNNSSTNEFSV